MMLYLFLTLTFFVAHSVDVWTPLVNESGEVYEGKITGEELSNWHGVQEFGGNNGYTFSDDCQSQGGLKSIKMQCTTFVSSLQLQCEKRRKYTRWSYYSRRYYSSYGSAWKSKRGYGSGKVTEIPATGIIRVEIEADDMVRQVRFYTGESTAFQCGKKTANGKTYSVSAPRGMQLCALRGRSRSFVMKLGAGWCYGKTKAPTRRPWWWRRNRYGVRRTTRSPYRRNNGYNYYNRWRNRYRVKRTTRSPYRRNSSSNRYNYYNRWRNRYRVRRTTRKATRRPYWWRSRNTRRATQRPYWWRYRNTRRATQRPYWRNQYYWRNRYSRYSPVITTKSPNRNSRSFYNYYATSVMIDDEKLEIPNVDIQEDEDAVADAQNDDEFNDNEDVEQQEEVSTPVFGIVGTLMAVGGFLGIAFVYFTKRDNDDVIYEQIPDHNDDDEP